MTSPAWTPRQGVASVCIRRGAAEVVTGCVELIEGREVDGELVFALGGPPARWAVTGGESGPDYWLRVWAARGLLYVWDDSAAPAVIDALGDEAWRVREMAAKVVARHRVGDALPVVAALADDPVARVRAAAERAVVRLTAEGA
jgi:HEAT repeat protein